MDQFAKLFNMVQDFRKDVDQRFKGIDQRFEGMKQRFEGIDRRFEGIEQRFERVESRLDKVESRIINMETEFGRKLDVLYFDWRETQKQFNEEVKTQLQILDTKVEALQMESTRHDREIKELYLVKSSKE